MNSSLLFRLASMPLTTQLYIHFTHIIFLKRNLFATKCDIDVITVQKFTSGRCVWGFSIVAPHPIDEHWSSDHFVRERNVVYIMGWVYTNILSTILCSFQFLNSIFFFFFLELLLFYSLQRRITSMNIQHLPVIFEGFFCFILFLWKTPAHCAVVYIILHTGT